MKLTNLALAALCVFAPMAHAGIVQLDLAPLYNIDGVANPGDSSQSSLDNNDSGGNFVFMTQSLATIKLGAQGNGLLNSGLYSANMYHPEMQLGYGLNTNGKNVLQFTGYTSARLTMGGYYSQIDVAAMGGGGNTNLMLALNYADGTVNSRIAPVYDWYSDFAPTADNYYIVDGLDRIKADLSSFENASDPALFGYRFLTDPKRQLLSIDFKTMNASPSNRLNVFGATATSVDAQKSADVPEPGSIALVLIGLAMFAYKRKQS